LTLRGVSRSVALATHSRAVDTEAIREQVNADSLVFYMGRDSGPEIAQQLIDAGRDGLTPVAIVEACSTPRERMLTLTLSGLACGEAQQWLDASQPSLLMIGEAFAARDGQVGGSVEELLSAA
jgi:uroporphyrin-III C-methyltransferase